MNVKVIIGFTVALLTLAGTAYAEGGCPQGFYPQNSPSVKSCIPFPSTGGGAVQTRPQWSSRWGAIAQDPTNGVLGAVANRENKRAAQKDSIAECRSRGGANCKVELAYTNQCVVTIQGSTAIDNAQAPSIERATQIGMDACEKRGDVDCHVYYKACSLPVRVR